MKAIVILVSLLSSTAYADRPFHVVRAGDSLGALALRYGVRIVDLRAWNDLEDDTILVGQELAVESGAIVRYRAVPGDTLSCIAERYGVSTARLREDNRALRRGLEAGMTLRIRGGRAPRTSANGRSESVGRATCGSIRGAVRLRAHPAFVLRDRSRAYGTQRTIDLIRQGFDAFARAHPNAPRVRVHDLSLPGGGPIDDHRSHQSGRDVDITYYRRGGCPASGCPLEVVTPEELDVRRQWTLLHHWLRRDVIEAIYVDRSLHEVLYREAQRRGATRAELARWFQHPRGPSADDELIRHFPNHANHLHVRFACAPRDGDCRD